jgi:hypothetical protein
MARSDVDADRLVLVGTAVAVVDRAELVLELSERRVPIAQHDAGRPSAFAVVETRYAGSSSVSFGPE